MPPLLHLANRSELGKASAEQDYAPAGFTDEGFIHCCWPAQLPGVIDRYYQGRADLVLLELDAPALGEDLVEEDLYGGGEAFPHLYARLPMSAIIRQIALELDDEHRLSIPENYRH